MNSQAGLPLFVDGDPTELVDSIKGRRGAQGLTSTSQVAGHQLLSGALLALDFPARISAAEAEQTCLDMWSSLSANMGALSQTVNVLLAVRVSTAEKNDLTSSLEEMLADISVEAVNTFGNDMPVNALLYSADDPLDVVASRLHHFFTRQNASLGDREIVTFEEIRHQSIALAIAQRFL